MLSIIGIMRLSQSTRFYAGLPKARKRVTWRRLPEVLRLLLRLFDPS